MSEKTKNNTGEQTDVRNNIIDFSTLDTKGREDDNETWNSLQYMCEDDKKEAEYESPDEISREAERRLSRMKAKFVGVRVMDVFNIKAA